MTTAVRQAFVILAVSIARPRWTVTPMAAGVRMPVLDLTSGDLTAGEFTGVDALDGFGDCFEPDDFDEHFPRP